MPRFENDYLKFVKEKMDERYEQGRFETIYDYIWRNIAKRYGKLSEKTIRTIEDIGYYPALEEIQDAITFIASKEAFEGELDAIVEKYREEIRARNVGRSACN